jgi:choline dehydrogenase-like flavoprotein
MTGLGDKQVEGDTSSDAVLDCDAVVVGSGAGGGVVAAQLAQAGLRVVVLERGGYRTAADLCLVESTACGAMYDRGGLTTSDNAGELFGVRRVAPTDVNVCNEVDWVLYYP